MRQELSARCSCFPCVLVLGCFLGLTSAFCFVILTRNEPDILTTLSVYVVLAGLFSYSLLSVMMRDAGSVPPEVLKRLDPASQLPLLRIESKRDGSARFCRACNVFKPDRTHHCHTCHRCHMRMDHHCAFVNNCVGYRNHKYFLMFLWWGIWTSCYVAYSVYHGLIFHRPVRNQAFHTFTLGCFLFGSIFGLVFTFFFGFQFFLAARGYTVLEFVEKRKKPLSSGKPFVNPFNVGVWRNLCQVLGDNPLLWFLPSPPPSVVTEFPVNAWHHHTPPVLQSATSPSDASSSLASPSNLEDSPSGEDSQLRQRAPLDSSQQAKNELFS